MITALLFLLKILFAVVVLGLVWIAGHFHGWAKAKRFYEVPDDSEDW